MSANVNVTEHQRPGVYSVYSASAVISGRRGGGYAGVAAVCSKGTAGQVYPMTGAEEAVTAFGADEELTTLVRLLLENGAGKVYAVPVTGEEGYQAAFEALEKVENISVVCCGSTTLTVQQALRDSVKNAAENRRERLAVIGGGDGETAEALIQRAAGINSERVVLTAPGGVKAAAALAGAIAGERDPAVPMGGAELKGLTGSEQIWTEQEIDTLIPGGVTPLEQVSGTVQVIRAVTTRTKTGEAADDTWRELTTIRVVDDVIPGLRKVLHNRFRRAKNTEQGRGAIRSQVVVELEQKLADEIITGYQNVNVSALPDNPTVCLVDFSFTVAHGLSQIWLSAHITV